MNTIYRNSICVATVLATYVGKKDSIYYNTSFACVKSVNEITKTEKYNCFIRNIFTGKKNMAFNLFEFQESFTIDFFDEKYPIFEETGSLSDEVTFVSLLHFITGKPSLN